MTSPDSTDAPQHTGLDAADHDALSRFVLEGSGVRGVMVRLDRTWAEIRSRAEYPDVIAERLGECCAAAALFTGHTKVDGRLTIQLNGQGPVRTLFAECTHEGTLRGIAQFTPPLPEAIGPREMGPDAVMAITIESRPPGKTEPVRYQGLVGLDAEDFPAAFEGYFSQSEQLPTRIVLAGRGERASGLMIQQLPGTASDPDGWARACAILDTLGADELQATPVATLLYRLFHEDDVRLLGARPLSFGCSCSRERVANVLISIGQDEAMAAADDGTAHITCEFCNARYAFTRAEVAALFAPSGNLGRLH